MSVEFIHLREMKDKEVHRSIAENISRFLYGRDDEEGVEEKSDFISSYKTAHKTGIEALVTFVLNQGKSLIDKDPNNYYLYLQCLGIYLLDTAEDVKEGIANNVINQLKTDLKENAVLYIKILSFLFSCLDQQSITRVTIFQELVKVCKAHNKEYLFIPYVDSLGKIMPVESLSEDKLCDLYLTLVSVLREKEKYKLLTQLVTSLFTILSQRSPAKVAPHKETIHRLLTYLITDEEEIFAVEDFLANPMLQEVLQADQKLMESWAKFTSGNLASAEEFFIFNEKYLKESGLTVEDIKDKMRYYKLSQVADENKVISIDELAKHLQWSADETELFLIKAIQYKFVDALIDQMSQKVYFRDVLKRNLKLTSKAQISKDFENLLEKLKVYQSQQTETN